MAGIKHAPKDPRIFIRKKQDMAYSYYTVEEKAATSFFNKKTAPEHITNKTTTAYKTMPLRQLKAEGMWNSRLDKIIPFMPKGAWIAGGFLRSVIAREDECGGDIDFFFNNEEAFNQMLELIKYPSMISGAEKAFGYYSLPEYDDIQKLRIIDCESIIEYRPNIQLVRLYWFDSPEHVIDSFDFTVCQFITDGETLWFNPKAFDDIATKTLRQHRPTGDALAVLNRYLKYQRKGYNFDPADFAKVEQDAIKVLENPTEISQYFYRDQVESDAHKHPESYLKYAWEYLEGAPNTKAAYAKAMKQKDKKSYAAIGNYATGYTITTSASTGSYATLDMGTNRSYSWDAS